MDDKIFNAASRFLMNTPLHIEMVLLIHFYIVLFIYKVSISFKKTLVNVIINDYKNIPYCVT